MKKLFNKIFVLTVASITLCGCSIVNPYHENFACRSDEGKGHCVGMDKSYGDSIGEIDLDAENQSDELSDCKDCELGKGKDISFQELANGGRNNDHSSEYQEAVYDRLTGLLKKPATPMVDPPKVMRVLILPYEDDSNILYMPRFTYLKVEDSRWVVGDYLVKEREN
jgi:conjugal transfer pilus assembly protein TraV